MPDVISASRNTDRITRHVDSLIVPLQYIGQTVPQRRAYIRLFSKSELDLVNEVIDDLWNQTAPEVSDASHDIIWQTREDQANIPYEAASLDGRPLTQQEIDRSHELARQFSWTGD